MALLKGAITVEIGSFGFGCCTTPPLLLVVFVLLSLLLLPQPVAATVATAQQSAAALIPLPNAASQVGVGLHRARERLRVKGRGDEISAFSSGRRERSRMRKTGDFVRLGGP